MTSHETRPLSYDYQPENERILLQKTFETMPKRFNATSIGTIRVTNSLCSLICGPIKMINDKCTAAPPLSRLGYK